MNFIKPITAVLAVGLISTSVAGYAPKHSGKGMSCASPSQNSAFAGNSFQAGSTSSKCWFKRVKVSGFAHFAYTRLENDYISTLTTEGTVLDTTTVSVNEALVSATKKDQTFQLNNANLFVDAEVNANTTAHMNLHYGNNDIYAAHVYGFNADGSSTDAATATALTSTANADTFKIDEAYVTYSDSARSPVYVKVGKAFASYGNYSDPYTMTPGYAQLFNQLSATSIEVGTNDSNSDWNASAWAYDSGQTVDKGLNKFGARIGYHHAYQGVGMDFNASMINDARTLQPTTGLKGYFMKDFSSATKRELAWNAHLGLNYQGVDASFDYTTTSGTLGDVTALTSPSTTALTGGISTATAKGEPQIYSFGLGYKFNAAGRDQSLTAGYEFTDKKGKAVFYGKNHWSAAYTANLCKGVEGYFAYDNYKMHEGNERAWYQAADANTTAGTDGPYVEELAGNKVSVFSVGLKAHM